MAKVIRATGPVPCDVMVVAERPGKEEANRGRVLCGPSGQELDRYLLIDSGIDRASVYCTNLVKDYREGENPEEWEIERDFDILCDEIDKVRPTFIACVGLHSARKLCGLDIDLEWAHGLVFPGNFIKMPLLHPAHGLHRPSEQGRIAWDFRQFGKLVRGEPLPTGHLSKPIPVTYSDSVLGLESVVAMDTEGTVDSPWGLSYCCRPGVASVQHDRPHRKWDCKRMDEALVILHNTLHDLPVLQRLGVRPRQFTDTMLAAALLGTEPLSLKALARRHCGMRMMEYADIIGEAGRDKALQYLGEVLDWLETQKRRENPKGNGGVTIETA